MEESSRTGKKGAKEVRPTYLYLIEGNQAVPGDSQLVGWATPRLGPRAQLNLRHPAQHGRHQALKELDAAATWLAFAVATPGSCVCRPSTRHAFAATSRLREPQTHPRALLAGPPMAPIKGGPPSGRATGSRVPRQRHVERGLGWGGYVARALFAGGGFGLLAIFACVPLVLGPSGLVPARVERCPRAD
jgi:hypothetical protein